MNKDKEVKRITKKYKAGKLEPRKDLPEDLKIAIRTFMEQVVIMEEYDTDYINGEYMANLIKAFSKYPEYSIFTYELVKSILGKTLEE
jgi:hypothetical protein|tara:strand:+ start:347 stop:610 length:264 start_codon:yes stop_codon:yes gene_type:complete